MYGAAHHLGDRLPAFRSGVPGFQYRVCLPSVLTQRHRRAALEDDYHRLAGGFERVQQITLRFGQGDAGTVATIEPWHLERHLLALEPGVEPDERNDRVGIGSHRNRLIAQRRDGRLPGEGDRKRVVSGKGWAVRLRYGGRR